MLPPLLQLKAISERFTKLALSPETSLSKLNRPTQGGATDFSHSRLVLSANMHGVLKIGVTTSALKIESEWKGLANPELDPTVVEGGEEGIRAHASTKMKEKDGDEGWAVVRVEGRDWGRVLGVGRLGGRVIACEFQDERVVLLRIAADVFCLMRVGFCHNNALILYVYLSNDDSGADDSVLTVRVPSVDIPLPKPPATGTTADFLIVVLHSIIQCMMSILPNLRFVREATSNRATLTPAKAGAGHPNVVHPPHDALTSPPIWP